MIYELDRFLTNKECDKFIELIDNLRNQKPFTNVGNFSNSISTDMDLANKFYVKLSQYNISDNILRPNDVITAGKYLPGNSFGLHTDTGLFYDPINKEETRWTLLIYLNDDYVGGSTEFYLNNLSDKKIIKPEKAKAILFDIDLWHKGNEVISGTKYWIGCEIIGKMLRQNLN